MKQVFDKWNDPSIKPNVKDEKIPNILYFKSFHLLTSIDIHAKGNEIDLQDNQIAFQNAIEFLKAIENNWSYIIFYGRPLH